METPLSDVRILLTGVSRGVGLAAARLLLDSGADLIGVARDSERLTAAADELAERGPGRFESVRAELSDSAAPHQITEKVQERWGALDVVVHNAGVMLHHEGGS